MSAYLHPDQADKSERQNVGAGKTLAEAGSVQVTPGFKLENLIPIAVVVMVGCETCTEKMVTRALEQGSSWQDIDSTLRIVANMQKLECFAKAAGPEVISRMEKPLAAGRRTLEQAMANRAR